MGRPPDGTLSHFGGLIAAIHRMETLFVSKEGWHFKDGAFFSVGPVWELHRISNPTHKPRFVNPKEYLQLFMEFLDKTVFYKTTLEFNKILPLQDCWSNDPIGSGGTQILECKNGLDAQVLSAAAAIFKPFTGIIMPEAIAEKLAKSDIQRMRKELKRDAAFNQQLGKRRKYLGEAAYALDRSVEIVWQYMTMRFFRWAEKQGYDAFSYNNAKEGYGETAFASFSGRSLKETEALVLDAKALFEKVWPSYENAVAANSILLRGRTMHSGAVLPPALWKQLDVESYLSPQSPQQLITPPAATAQRHHG